MEKRKMTMWVIAGAVLLIGGWFFALFNGLLPGPDAKKAAGLQAEIKTSLPPGSSLAQVKAVLDRREIPYSYYKPGDALFLSGFDGAEWNGIPRAQIGGYTDSSLETRAGGVWGGERVFLYFVFDRNGKLLRSFWHAFQPGF